MADGSEDGAGGGGEPCAFSRKDMLFRCTSKARLSLLEYLLGL